jgi:Protein of unknown function (DUF992)
MSNYRMACTAALTGLCLLLVGGTDADARKRGGGGGEGVRIGLLSCQVAGGASFIIGSSKDLRCRFESASGRHERYFGVIDKFGLDIGVTGPAQLSWAVFAPSTDVGRGALAGNYVGASAGASIGVGGGANLLVGGSNETISLQPLSIQGQTGVNAALAVAGLVLRPS